MVIKSFFIKTFGCQMNVSDSERIAAILSEQGMQLAAEVSKADLIIVNGCTVRDKAVHKAVSALGELQDLKKGRAHGPFIGIGGCVGQFDKGNLFKRAPYLDFVFGTDAIDSLPEIINRVVSGERHIALTEFDKSMDYSTETKIYAKKAQAFVNIMKGCDKFCTYCVVPFTRGREKSRSIEEIVGDIGRLVSLGVKEVTLLGQNVNSYGKGQFPALLRAIDTDPRCLSLRRIRFTSSHPLDFSEELIRCFNTPENGGVSRLASHLHLPVQSGSDSVLRKMGRHHDIWSFITKIDTLRSICPDVGLSTDIIVGFPSEAQEDFDATLALIDRVEFDNIFAFAYSARPGTKAAKMQDDVSEKTKKERLNTVLHRQLKIAGKRYASRVGKVMEILVEGAAKNQNLLNGPSPGVSVWTGRTSCNRVVNFPADHASKLGGSFVNVKITGSTSLSLYGELQGGLK
ncbi:MAG: tRNA (N6-isopentenyl adenosine(37)-C2)-methylthiotransferase MiaB [Bdellovibrionota bacterium]